ncbi:MAG TPA: GtrA family protein [Chitinophagaceae bacterium]|nr:GtrA family protein [Chitinophagaceae bacterium]
MSYPAWTLKLVKFGCVGITGACIDFGTTYLLKEKAKWNKFVANSIGFTLAVINNFFLNRAWTFEGSVSPLQVEFGKFVLVSVIGLGINNLSLYLMHKKLNMNFYIAKVLTTVFVVAWNFTANYLFTFK